MSRYIDADALRKEFSERPPDYYSTGYILDTIDEQPALSPDDVRGVGEWIKAHDDTVWWWECSVCHEQPLQRYKYDRLSNYCPSCGAKMEVSE